MKRVRGFIVLLLFFLLLSFTTTTTYAHLSARDHNNDLEAVLFEKGFSKYQSNEIKDNIKALEYASYLAIDQFGGDGEDKYNTLKNMKMGGLPHKFSAIDYDYVIGSSDKHITANTHRKYTHQGWDRNYFSKNKNEKDAKKFWDTRRKVLLGTVNSVFDFDTVTIFGYGDECNSMAGIIYYVHILGDYDEADKYTKISLLPDLAGRDNANDTDKDYDIITSLKGYVGILFSDQKSSREYKKLNSGLDDIAKKAGKLVKSTGGVNTDEEFEEYHQYTDETLNLMIEYMPALLKNEDFFAKKFYPKKTR